MNRGRFRTIAVTVATLSIIGLAAPLTDAAQPSPRRMLITSHNEVLSLSPDGTDPRTLAELPVISGADWGPGGRQVAYAGTRCLQVCAAPLIPHRTELRVMDADGSHDRVLLTLPVSHIWTVDWSPDGTWIAFVAGHGYTCWGCPPPWALHLYNVRNRSQLVLGPATDLDWSPDSRRIALTHAGGIHVVDVANGAVPTRVTATEIGAGSPSWSPDGKLIAFLRNGEVVFQGNHRLWVMRPDGSGARALHRVGWAEVSWAPDSRSIATVNPTHDRIQVTAIDGSARHEIRPPRGTVSDVTWSPRGTTIAYLLDPEWDDPTAVRAVRPDGSHDRAIHSAQWLQSPIRWSP